jgi:protein involved in polysaccharide export with SLBB domain
MGRAHALWIAALLAACASSGRQVPVPIEARIPDDPLVEELGPGDVVEIRVFREPSLDGSFQISSDGKIDYPLVGLIDVAGRTPSALQRLIATKLEDGYLVNAKVTVLVKEKRAQKIHVLGAVKRPGSFPFETGMTVIQAITNAGGFSELAARNSVVVTRREEDGREVTFQVRVGAIQSGEASNVYLRPRDIVFVKETIF